MWMYGWIAACVAAGMLTTLVPGSVYRSIEKKWKNKRYQEIKWFRRLYLKRSMEQKKRTEGFHLCTLRVMGITLTAWEKVWTWFAGLSLLPGIALFIAQRLDIPHFSDERWEYLMLSGMLGVFFMVLGVYRGNWTERRTHIDRMVEETLLRLCTQEGITRDAEKSDQEKDLNGEEAVQGDKGELRERNCRNVEKMDTRNVRQMESRNTETAYVKESGQDELVGELFRYFFETPADEM